MCPLSWCDPTSITHISSYHLSSVRDQSIFNFSFSQPAPVWQLSHTIKQLPATRRFRGWWYHTKRRRNSFRRWGFIVNVSWCTRQPATWKWGYWERWRISSKEAEEEGGSPKTEGQPSFRSFAKYRYEVAEKAMIIEPQLINAWKHISS